MYSNNNGNNYEKGVKTVPGSKTRYNFIGTFKNDHRKYEIHKSMVK